MHLTEETYEPWQQNENFKRRLRHRLPKLIEIIKIARPQRCEQRDHKEIMPFYLLKVARNERSGLRVIELHASGQSSLSELADMRDDELVKLAHRSVQGSLVFGPFQVLANQRIPLSG